MNRRYDPSKGIFWRPTLKRFRVPLKRFGVDIRQVQS